MYGDAKSVRLSQLSSETVMEKLVFGSSNAQSGS
jgi:hypothetical protein